MKATVVDLRYKMNEVLKALDRGEKVTLLYHGKIKGVIVPAGAHESMDVEGHPFFNMATGDKRPVEKQMEELRRSRFHDI